MPKLGKEIEFYFSIKYSRSVNPWHHMRNRIAELHRNITEPISSLSAFISTKPPLPAPLFLSPTPLVDGALASEFLWEVRDQGSKSEIYPPTSPSFEFNFERCSASRSDLKALIHQVREIFVFSTAVTEVN